VDARWSVCDLWHVSRWVGGALDTESGWERKSGLTGQRKTRRTWTALVTRWKVVGVLHGQGPTRSGRHSWDQAERRYASDTARGYQVHRRRSGYLSRRTLADVHIRRIWPIRGLRSAVSEHERSEVGGIHTWRHGAGVVAQWERVVLPRWGRQPGGGSSTDHSDVLRRRHAGSLSGCRVSCRWIGSPICCSSRRSSLPHDSALCRHHGRQTDSGRELVRGAQGEVAEVSEADDLPDCLATRSSVDAYRPPPVGSRPHHIFGAVQS